MNDAQTFKRIKKVLDFVWTSPYSSFYRDKYKKAGIDLAKDIKSIADFKKLPLLTREDIINTDPHDRFFMPQEKIRWVHISGGTTGGKVFGMFKATLAMPSTNFRVKKALDLKIKTAMIILTETAFLAPLTRQSFRHKSIVRCLGSVYDLSRTAKIVKDLKVEALQTSPTVLELAIPHFKKENITNLIRYIILSGELCSNPRYKYFKKVFKNASFSFEFGCNEASLIGYSCPNIEEGSERNIFHPLDSNIFYETVTPEKENYLVLTHLTTKTELPLIRYNTADSASISKSNCKCGLGFKMKAFGRYGIQMIKVRDYMLYSEKLDNALSSVYKYLDSFNYKLLIFDYTKKQILPKFNLQLVSKKNLRKDIKSLIKRQVIQQFFVSEDLSFNDLVKKKIFLPLEVEFVDSFGLLIKHKPFVYHLDE